MELLYIFGLGGILVGMIIGFFLVGWLTSGKVSDAWVAGYMAGSNFRSNEEALSHLEPTDETLT